MLTQAANIVTTPAQPKTSVNGLLVAGHDYTAPVGRRLIMIVG